MGVTRHGLSLALATLAVAGCESGGPPTKPQVVATVYPLWEFSRQVAGARADAVALVHGLPHAELVTTEGLGHRRILSDERVTRAAAEFIDAR